jgi:hypothetical protein
MSQRGPPDPWVDAAHAAHTLLQPTLRIGSRVTLSTDQEFRGHRLNNDSCRELVTPRLALPATEPPELSTKEEG